MAAGIGVNVTLLFSDSHYLRTADAYLRALERRKKPPVDVAVPSVASVFVSLAAPETIDTVPEKTLLAFADHGNLDGRLEPDYPSAERVISAVASSGIDVDALAEDLQRRGAGAFSADWATLLDGMAGKAARIAASG